MLPAGGHGRRSSEASDRRTGMPRRASSDAEMRGALAWYDFHIPTGIFAGIHIPPKQRNDKHMGTETGGSQNFKRYRLREKYYAFIGRTNIFLAYCRIFPWIIAFFLVNFAQD